MFRTLPPANWSDDDLQALALKMSAPPEATANADEEDGEENFGLPAGYTYFGQFIDHDLTFDPASKLQQTNDPDALVDFRTPRFDLDCLYGRGPDDQPYLYDGFKLLFGRPLTFGDSTPKPTPDLQRNIKGSALIGDKRNDENVIVSQIHAGMMQFHNGLVDVMKQENPDVTFDEIAQAMRSHYQWAVLYDFLKRIVKPEVLDQVAPHINKGTTIVEDPPNVYPYHFDQDPFIPIEFTAAAYRMGHSMVRPVYRLSRTLPQRKIFGDRANEGLNGFRKFPESWGIEWDLFFGDPTVNPEGPGRVQPAYKLDTSLVDPLSLLPEFIQKDGNDDFIKDPVTGQAVLEPGAITPNLSLRNLMRGRSMSLPSGQSVALALGFTPLLENQIRVGKATGDDWKDSIALGDIAAGFVGNAPLWTYILAEAAFEWSKKAFPEGDVKFEHPVEGADRIPVHLGDVGSTIVAKTFLGLMMGDSFSYLRQNPLFKPRADMTTTGNPMDFGVFDLVRPK